VKTVQTGNETGNAIRKAKRPDDASACQTVSCSVGAPGIETGDLLLQEQAQSPGTSQDPKRLGGLIGSVGPQGA
jgi:hypothetical protein